MGNIQKADTLNKLKKLSSYRDAKRKELEYMMSTRFKFRLLMRRGMTIPYILPVNYCEVE